MQKQHLCLQCRASTVAQEQRKKKTHCVETRHTPATLEAMQSTHRVVCALLSAASFLMSGLYGQCASYMAEHLGVGPCALVTGKNKTFRLQNDLVCISRATTTKTATTFYWRWSCIMTTPSQISVDLSGKRKDGFIMQVINTSSIAHVVVGVV